MNSKPRSHVFLVLFALLAGFGGGYYVLMQNALNSEVQLTARRIQSSLGEILEHAHHLQDDLVMQSAVKGLSEGPGIVFSTLVNQNGKIIADSQPAKLGLAYRMPRLPSDRVTGRSYELKDGDHLWGTLYFGLSRASLRHSLAQQVFITFLWVLGFSVWVLWVWTGWEKALTKEQKQIDEMTLLIKEQNRDLEMLKKCRNEEDTLRLCQIQSAADQFQMAAILLDHHQRVIAFNKRAQILLEKGEGQKGWIGCSWQDIPTLKHQGEALQQSIESPGQYICTSASSSKIRLFSQAAPHNLGTITWVYVESL